MSRSWIDQMVGTNLYLGPDQVLLRAGGAVRRAVPADPGWQAALAALHGLLEQHKPAGRVAIALSAGFAPLWLLPGTPTRLDHEETRGWVEGQVAERYGDLAAAWNIAFLPAAAGEPILAAGIDASHWAQLLDLLTGAGLKPVMASSWPALALAQYAGRNTARLALVDSDRLCLVSLRRGAPVALASQRGLAGESAADLVSRAALVDGLGEVPTLLAGCGVAGDWGGAKVLANAPETALVAGGDVPDFLQERPRPPLAAWLLLAAGAGLAMLAGQRYLDLNEQLAQSAPPPAIVAAKAKTRGAVAEPVAAARPWGELLDRLETGRPEHIALLSLRGDARRGEARLTAEARSEADMLAWLTDLRGDAGLRNPSLVHHEILDQEGRHPVAFELQLGWGAR